MELTIRNIAKQAGYALVQWGKAKTAKVKEALSPSLFGLIAGDTEDPRFRRISSPATLRDLNPVMHERMQQVSFYMKATNPMAKRLVQLITSYCVGEGFKVVAKDAAVQQVIDRFWNDDINQMSETIRAWSDELATMGELCVPVAVNEYDGFVRLGWIDPINVSAVEYGQIATLEGSQVVAAPFAVHLKKLLNDSQPQVRLTVVRKDDDPNSQTYGFLNGQCFFLAVNKAKSATRGISDIFAISDHLDAFDQLMFDSVDRARMLSAFVWQVKLKGADEKKVENEMKWWTKNPPRQGQVKVTNEQVEILPQTPQFHGADMSAFVGELKKYNVGTSGFSPMFFGDPVDSNKSTADAMEGPTGKMLTDRQNVLRGLITRLLEFVIDQAILHSVLPQEVDRSFTLQVPDLLIKDIQRASQTLVGISGAMAVAEDRGWVRGETAARALHVVLTQLGVEVDSQEEYALAQQEMQDRQARQIDNMNAQSELAQAMKELAGGSQDDSETPSPGAAAAAGMVN